MVGSDGEIEIICWMETAICSFQSDSLKKPAEGNKETIKWRQTNSEVHYYLSLIKQLNPTKKWWFPLPKHEDKEIF